MINCRLIKKKPFLQKQKPFYDILKTECFNCYKMGYMVRECKLLKKFSWKLVIKPGYIHFIKGDTHVCITYNKEDNSYINKCDMGDEN